MSQAGESLESCALRAAGSFAPLSCLLMVPLSPGTADKGDYARVMIFFDPAHTPRDRGDRCFGRLDASCVLDGILRDSRCPQEDLKAPGLNPQWAAYANSTAFAAGSPRFKPEFAGNFLKRVNLHRLCHALRRGLNGSFALRPRQPGGYTGSAGKPAGSKTCSWAMWSTARIAALPRALRFLLSTMGGYRALLAREWRKDETRTRRLAIEPGAMVPLMALEQPVLISIADGAGDVVEHGFLFNLPVDIMLGVLIACGWSRKLDRHAKMARQPSKEPRETAI